MNAPELQALIDQGTETWAMTVATIGSKISINGLVAIPVAATDCSLPRSPDLPIEDHAGAPLGTLCFCRDGADVDLTSISDWRRAAYLTEVPATQYNLPYRFLSDYAVISEGNLARYESELAPIAPLWGGFTHALPQSTSSFRTVTQLRGLRQLRLPTTHHARCLDEGISARNPRERFLKYYHQLELLFDWVVIQKLRALGNDLVGVGRLMSDYAAGDLPRLKHIVKEYCTDSAALSRELLRIAGHVPLAKTLLVDYGKDGSPLKDHRWDAFVLCVSQGTLDATAAKQNKLSNADQFDALIREICSYFIYRIRCSVAHHRIGEFILSDAHDDFVVQVGEPLLREVLVQVLSNPALPA